MTNMKLLIPLLLIILIQSGIILIKPEPRVGADIIETKPIEPIEKPITPICPTCPRCLFTMPVRTTTTIKRSTTTQINLQRLRQLINR